MKAEFPVKGKEQQWTIIRVQGNIDQGMKGTGDGKPKEPATPTAP